MKSKFLLIAALTLLFGELSAQVTLYDQTANVTTGGILVREHTTAAQSTFSTEGADDFTIPAGQTWTIDSIVALGFYGATVPTPPALSPAIVTIYTDNAGLPGTTVFADTLADGDIDDDGDFECIFPNPIVLTAGTYFLSVRMYETSTPWYWARITEQVTNYQFLWQNPGGGYAVCTAWQALNPCLAIADSSVAFSIYGCYGAKPVVNLTNDTTLCGGDSIVLQTDPANAGLQHIWSTNETTNTITTSISGNYSVTVLDATTQCSAIESMNLTVVDPITSPDLMDDSICAGETTILSISTCPTCTTLWSTGSTFNNAGFTQAGTYSVSVTEPVSSCQEVLSFDLSIIDPNLVVLPGNTANLCAGESVVLSTVDDYLSYSWDSDLPGNNSSNADSVVASLEGNYFVTVTDSFGCQASDTITVIRRDPPIPSIAREDVTDSEVRLFTSEPFDTYLWSNGGTGRSTNVTSNGTYSVTVTNEFGCEATVSITIFNIINGLFEYSEQKLKIYPNPTNGILQITWPSDWGENSMNRIVDLQGKIVHEFQSGSTTETIDLSALPAGTYTLSSIGSPGTINALIVIQ